MRILAALVLAALPAAAAPPRYRWEPGDAVTFTGEFRFESLTKRGVATERLAFTRPGRQRVMAYGREGSRTLFAVEVRHEAAKLTTWQLDGRDRAGEERDAAQATLPGPEDDVSFLSLDDRGEGEAEPLDADLTDAVLKALSDVEVLPADDAAKWTRSGAVGPVAFESASERKGDEVVAMFSFKPRDDRGAKLVFEKARSLVRLDGGRPTRIEGSATWTVSTEAGSERREILYVLDAKEPVRLDAAEIADLAFDSAPAAAAEQAWREGELDRAVESWDRVARDGTNRWAERAKERLAEIRRERPLLGATVPAWTSPGWIGAPPASGKWQLVYFWATWAASAKSDLGSLAQLARGHDDLAAAAVTMVDALQDEDTIRRFVGGLDLPFGVALDDGGAFRAFKIDELPRVFLIDPEGKVRFEGRGSEHETLGRLVDRFVPR